MLKIWGRNDGSNVIKVMWCLGELGIEYERIDWGGPFGGNDEPEYRRKNPNGRLPTLEEEDGFTLWESGAVLRYLCAKHSMGKLYPEDLRERASADKWMDWSSLNLAAFNPVYLDYYFRQTEAERLAHPDRDRPVVLDRREEGALGDRIQGGVPEDLWALDDHSPLHPALRIYHEFQKYDPFEPGLPRHFRINRYNRLFGPGLFLHGPELHDLLLFGRRTVVPVVTSRESQWA